MDLSDQDLSDTVGYVPVDDSASFNGLEELYRVPKDMESAIEGSTHSCSAYLIKSFHFSCPFTYHVTTLVDWPARGRAVSKF